MVSYQITNAEHLFGSLFLETKLFRQPFQSHYLVYNEGQLTAFNTIQISKVFLNRTKRKVEAKTMLLRK